MPIKSCTRCGLKVLVDATAAASDTYLCPRCAPDAKPAAAPKPFGGKRASIKVICPYCGASFSGSMPSRPAKGGCPVCQKELVLLPDGTIQAAATFNLATWQKERKPASNPPAAPEAPEMPAAPDPLGGSTILDMGGPPPASPPPSLDEPVLPSGVGDQTMLGMGQDLPDVSPAPSIEEPAAEPPRDDEATLPPDLGGATILDMGPRPVELPAPDIEEPAPEPDLLSETMPGMDRPPAEESPVEPPIPPPIPEEPVAAEADPTEGPTLRDSEMPPAEEEPQPASIESAPEIPGDFGGQTILGMGGSDESRYPAPEPSIEEPPPEAVPILAQDVGSDAPPDPNATGEPGQATPKPYAYQPIPRVPRKSGSSVEPPPGPPSQPRMKPPSSTPPTTSVGVPVLGSDFRIQGSPPDTKPKREEKKPAGPTTAAIVLPRAHHSLKKLVLAWILLLMPAGVGYALHSIQKNPAVEKVLQGITSEVLPGILKLESAIRKASTKAEEPVEEEKKDEEKKNEEKKN